MTGILITFFWPDRDVSRRVFGSSQTGSYIRYAAIVEGLSFSSPITTGQDYSKIEKRCNRYLHCNF